MHTRRICVTTGLFSSAPFSYSRYTVARLPYRRPSFDFTTGSGCNSTSLRTDSRRLAALATRRICLPSAVIGHDRVDFPSAREGRFHGRVKVAPRNRWCKRRIGIFGGIFELVLRDKFGEISTVTWAGHDFHEISVITRGIRAASHAPSPSSVDRELLLSMRRKCRGKFRNFFG